MKGISIGFMIKHKESDILKEFDDLKQRLNLVCSKVVGPWKLDIQLFEKDVVDQEIKNQEYKMHDFKYGDLRGDDHNKQMNMKLPEIKAGKDRIVSLVDTEQDICTVISDVSTKRACTVVDPTMLKILTKSPYKKEVLQLQIDGLEYEYSDFYIKVGVLKSRDAAVRVVVQISYAAVDLVPSGVPNTSAETFIMDWFKELFKKAFPPSCQQLADEQNSKRMREFLMAFDKDTIYYNLKKYHLQIYFLIVSHYLEEIKI